MKKAIFFFALLLASASQVLFAQYTSWVHTTTAANLNQNYTWLDNPATNNNPNAVVLANAEFSGAYKSIGVWYDGSRQKWAVFYQDLSTMPQNRKFHIAVVPSGFVHTVTKTNINKHLTVIDNPATNNEPNMVINITQRYDKGYNNRAVGVWYNSGIQKWCIFNEDLSNLTAGLQFNIHVSTAASPPVNNPNGSPMVSNFYIQNGVNVMPQAQGDPNDVLLVTHCFNPNNLYYNSSFEVGRDIASLPNQWAVWGNPTPQNGLKFSVLTFAKP
ncbi:MAG: hypothetical protein ACKVTZ_03820 [Bacteroidia bacterium]